MAEQSKAVTETLALLKHSKLTGWGDDKCLTIHQHLLRALVDEIQQAQAELNGDGSCSSAPLKSLGLRTCLELQQENIALEKARADALQAQVDAMTKSAIDIGPVE